MTPSISTLFLDIGGVLLTNGWDRTMRLKAAQQYNLDFAEMDERHHLTFDTYEEGKLSLNDYLDRVVFYQPRSFTLDDFKAFMFSQSRPFPDMIQLITDLKQRYHLRVAAVSNEGRELTVYRIRTFELARFIDFFVVSSFVHFRKPDHDIYRLALDISQSPPQQVVYIEDRSLFVEEAIDMGIHGLQHRGLDATRSALQDLGLK